MNEVDGKLLTNPKVDVPQWINDIQFNTPVERKMDIQFDKNVINRKHVIAERNEGMANVRELKYSFNDKQLQVFAMNELAKFLKDYRYTAEAEVSNNKAKIVANLVNNPLQYTFNYESVDGKIIPNKVFTTKVADIVNEYPYSKAGLEDSIEDSTTIDLKNPTKVKKAAYQYTVMTRYEILQRCNNRLEVARDLINQHIKDGNIVAVGSNEYASTYDMNYLFPDKREKYAGEENHTLEFVNNKVAKASYENKSANRLALEASNILNRVFNVYKIVNASRDNDNLFITSYISHNNMRDKYSFIFNVENEKVAKLQYIEDEKMNRYTAAQLLQKFGADDKDIVSYLNNSDKQINGGYVYSMKSIKDRLRKYISMNNIQKMMQNWETNHDVTKLNSTTYASKKSLNELVRGCKFLNQEQIQNIRKASATFGENEHFYSYETKDNDTRNQEALKKIANQKDKVYNKIQKYFKNFDVKMLSADKFVISFKNDNQKKRIVSARLDNENIICKVGSKEFTLDKLSNVFKRSTLLSSYVTDEDEDISQEHKLVISKKQFANKLKDYLTNEQIDELINHLVDSGKLIRLNSKDYASEYTFNSLLNEYVGTIDSSIKEDNLVKANRNTLKELVRHYMMDNDTRTEVALSNKEQKYQKAYNAIGKYLSDFDLKMIDDNHMVIAFKSKDNKQRKLFAEFNGNKITCSVGNNKIQLENLVNRFKNSVLLSAYLKENHSDEHSNVILSSRDFYTKLEDMLTKEEIKDMIDGLIQNHIMTKISSNLYASKNSFEDILRNSNLNVSKTLKEENLEKKNKVADKVLEKDYVNDNDTRKAEKKLSISEFKSQFNYALPKHLICKSFGNISIDDTSAHCTAEIFNKKNGISITASFDMAVKDGIINTENEQNLDELFKLATINKTYNKYNDDKKEAHEIVFSKRELTAKLNKIADAKDIDNAINEWVEHHYIEQLDTDKFASKYSIDKLLSMSNVKAYQDDVVKENYKHAKVSAEFVPKEYHVQDTDSKDLKNISDGKTDEYLKSVKSELHEKLNHLVQASKITKNRAGKLEQRIQNADNYLQLNEVDKQLNRYC